MNNNKIEFWTNIGSIIGTLAAVVGLFLVFAQLSQSNRIEKDRISFDVIQQTTSLDFVKAFGKAKEGAKLIHEGATPKDLEEFWNSFNLVNTKYNLVSFLYQTKSANRDLLKSALFEEMVDFQKSILDKLQISEVQNNRNTIDNTLSLMQQI